MPITYTSKEQIEVYRFSLPITFMLPLIAVFLQAFLPLRLPFLSMFDLPLLVVIFFAISRRNPIAGSLTGALVGILQDALTHQPLGIYGISNTIVGYLGSSLGVKIDVENSGTRFLMTLIFFTLHQIIYFSIARGMAQIDIRWSWQHELIAGVANAVLAVVLFRFFDRFKQRT